MVFFQDIGTTKKGMLQTAQYTTQHTTAAILYKAEQGTLLLGSICSSTHLPAPRVNFGSKLKMQRAELSWDPRTARSSRTGLRPTARAPRTRSPA